MNPRLDDAALESMVEQSLRGEIVGSDVRVLIEELRYHKQLAEERGKALGIIYGIATETFESPNQLDLIIATAAENMGDKP